MPNSSSPSSLPPPESCSSSSASSAHSSSAVLILAVLGVVGFVLGRPFVERLAARSIEDRVGTPVSVSIATSVKPGMLRGDLGNVTVTAKKFEHNGLRLAGAQAVYHGVAVELSDLLSGDVRLRYSSVDFEATLTQSGACGVPTAAAGTTRPALQEPARHDRQRHGDAAHRQAACRCGSQNRGVVVDPAPPAQRLGNAPARALGPIQLGPAARRRPPHRHRTAQGPRRRSQARGAGGTLKA